MTDDDHVDAAFDRLLATYGEPYTDNKAGFAGEFRGAVEGFPPKSLQLAVTRWIRSNTPYWPRPGQLAEECRRVLVDPLHRRPVPVGDVNVDPRPAQTPEQRERVRKMRDDALAFLASPQTAIDDADTPDWVGAQRTGLEAMQGTSTNYMHRRSP